MDGGGRLTLLYRILLPMTMPTVVMAVLQFISAWNSYFWPLIMTNSNDMRVLTVGISMLRDSIAGDEADVLPYHYGRQRHGDCAHRHSVHVHAEAYRLRDGQLHLQVKDGPFHRHKKRDAASLFRPVASLVRSGRAIRILERLP
ncbi:carbohydrate ABC transporter permease [Paenibacillus thiaminolyticus]|uniref:Carbohydrate ABC transporter permease n=1 Tax=Paenibacillus thiaminolyticus TaxID=49283 RepID=A0A3A3GFN1_PANTH|nr:carbohydrate ABC transporter permease [Paenibacillus thiaminolyticus]